MGLRVPALPIGGELVPGAGGAGPPRSASGSNRWRPDGSPLVAHADPHPRGGGPAAAGGERGHGGVVQEDGLVAERVPPGGDGERLQERRRPAHPAGRRRAVQVEAVRPKIWPWRHEGRWSPCVETRTWASSPCPGRPRSMGREGSGAWTNRSHPPQAKRGRVMRFTAKRPFGGRTVPRTVRSIRLTVLEFLGDVFAQTTEPPSTSRAGVLAGGNLDLHARHVVGDRPAPGAARFLVLVLLGQAQAAHDGAGRHLARLERQSLPRTRSGVELLGALARGAVAMRPSPCQPMPELLDQGGLSLHPSRPGAARGPSDRRCPKTAGRPRRAWPTVA